ncbi:MAG: hypothetical protein HKUEN01_33480 [Candidatus Kuenenia stuttgartiensis]|uniref:PIN domain-containing protein n=1 Tax=Kuenenia stuttgartiensis TaxID=174633 RepID=Q1PW14_KUEST|nr:PIN domain-containing protein [Candidatus Kuenenia stuttgartiensis]GJQ50962.1 MAG: hypothetical protein HKUEN01_33480 [Candidatus Kuenenia stuttgartiensis]CAJ71409.1 hypothetical protein kustc0664 [Candidatus Kuenenia stuttgartiensis]
MIVVAFKDHLMINLKFVLELRQTERITLSDKIVKRAKEFEMRNIKAIDALHLAIADVEKIDYLCTCDDRFRKSASKIKKLDTKIVSPIEFIEECENDYDNK